MITISSSLAAGNVVLAVLCAGVSIFCIQRVRQKQVSPDAVMHVLGLAVFAGGWALHRSYWAINRALESLGHHFLLTDWYTSSSWITLIPMALIVVGIGGILAPTLEYAYNGFWQAKFILTVATMWILLAGII